MLYIDELNFQRQIDLLAFIASQSTLSLCVWLYPESKVLTVADQEVSKINKVIQPVTEYDDGFLPQHTELSICTYALLNSLLLSKMDVVKNCDSIALYKENESQWEVATIGHEGMCLVRDITLLSLLKNAGFSVSLKPPSWW